MCVWYGSLSAASINVDAPKATLPNRTPIIVQVSLDPERDTLSGIAGDLSFPADLFTLGKISTESSVVSLWVTQPSISKDQYLDNRTHVTFEGVFPGGYSGVRSPYYQGKRTGLLFYVQLIPKASGKATILVDDILMNAYDSDATPLTTESAVAFTTVPQQVDSSAAQTPLPLTWIPPVMVTALITQDELVNSNAWYVLVNEEGQKVAVRDIFVAETDDHNAQVVSENSWRSAKSPYILSYQERTKFVHLKIIYTDNTYTTVTLPPVENSKSIFTISRILVSILTALVVVYLYGKHILILFLKKIR